MYDEDLSLLLSHETNKQDKDKAHPAIKQNERSTALRVLLVDDDFTINVQVTAMLEVHGCRVDHAKNGAKALHRMATKRYDLVLADLYMPVMDGRQLASAIRSQWPDTKIAIMTGSGNEDAQSKPAVGQVDAWLLKPFGLEEIRRVLGLR